MSLGIKLSNFIFVDIVNVSTNNNTKPNIIICIMLLLANYVMLLMLCSVGNFLKTYEIKVFATLYVTTKVQR